MTETRTGNPSTSMPAKVVVVASTSFNSVTVDALVSAAPAMAQHFGDHPNSAFLAQMVLVTPSISIIIGAPIAGYLSHKFGLRRLMVFCSVVYVATGCYGSIAPDPASLIVSRVLLGLMSSLMGALALSRAREFDYPEQSRLLGFANAMAAAVAIASFILGGFVAQAFGWRAASLLYCWPVLLIPAILRGVPVAATQVQKDHGVKEPFPWKAMTPIFALTLLVNLSVFASSIEGPFVMSSRGLNDPSLLGIAVSGSAFLCVITAIAYGRLARRLSTQAQFIAIFAIYCLSALAVVATMGIGAGVAGITFSGVAGGLLAPLIYTLMIRLAPAAHVATALGISVSCVFLSLFIAPAVFQMVRQYTPLSPYGALLAINTLCLCVAVVRMAIRRTAGAGRSPDPSAFPDSSRPDQSNRANA